MASTDALAVVGALTGMTGAALGVISFARDRAKIVLVTHRVATETPTAGLEVFSRVYVVNSGRQPIPIRRVGLHKASSVNWRARRATHMWFANPYEDYEGLSDEDEPIVLQPGEFRKFILIASSPAFESHSQLFVPYAIDYRGRKYFGRTVIAGISVTNWISAKAEPQDATLEDAVANLAEDSEPG
jgi:hypothetical protein